MSAPAVWQAVFCLRVYYIPTMIGCQCFSPIILGF
nr:MAG TPA: hypothetical protein [Caudoviricetes sp.]